MMDTSETYVKKYKNRNWLFKQYIIEGKSMKQLRKEYGWGINTLKRWFHYHGIPIRQIGNPIVKQQNSRPKELNGRWKGYVNNNGYRYIYLPNHPKANKHGQVSESRVVAEEKIGRSLKKNEVVHHIDGLRSNNSPENLHVCLQKDHKGIHADMEIIVYELLDAGKVIFLEGTYQLAGG